MGHYCEICQGVTTGGSPCAPEEEDLDPQVREDAAEARGEWLIERYLDRDEVHHYGRT